MVCLWHVVTHIQSSSIQLDWGQQNSKPHAAVICAVPLYTTAVDARRCQTPGHMADEIDDHSSSSFQILVISFWSQLSCTVSLGPCVFIARQWKTETCIWTDYVQHDKISTELYPWKVLPNLHGIVICWYILSFSFLAGYMRNVCQQLPYVSNLTWCQTSMLWV